MYQRFKPAADAAGPQSASGDPTDAPIDEAHLARYTFADRRVEQEVLELFAQFAQTSLATLEAAAADGAVPGEAWAYATHSLKGSARGVGALRVATLAEKAERVGADRAAAAVLVAALAVAVEEVCGYVAARGQTPAPWAGAEFGSASPNRDA